jgi:hypothetical protein
MLKVYFSWLTAASLLLSGCATAEKSTVFGGALGAILGGSIGAMATHHGDSGSRTAGLILGAGLGGVLGSLVGRETYKSQDKKDVLRGFDGNSPYMEIIGNGSDKDKRPTLKPAQVKVRYIDDAVKDSILIPAHLEYEISEPARWENSK